MLQLKISRAAAETWLNQVNKQKSSKIEEHNIGIILNGPTRNTISTLLVVVNIQ